MFYEKDITDGNGEPLKVVWEYDGSLERYRKDNPAEFFENNIIPLMQELTTYYWGSYIDGLFGCIVLYYNYERICFITNGNPLSCSSWSGSTSFPSFVYFHLSKWVGKRIECYQNMPPTNPFCFTCYSFQSGNNTYYLQADTEKALTRNFNKFPVTEDESAIWNYIVRSGKMDRAKDDKRAQFVAGYLSRKGQYFRTKSKIHLFKTITI